MSSNLWLTKICEHCGDNFTARTTVTKFCGHRCASRASMWTFHNKFTEEQFLACYQLLSDQEWRDTAPRPMHVMENLPKFTKESIRKPSKFFHE